MTRAREDVARRDAERLGIPAPRSRSERAGDPTAALYVNLRAREGERGLEDARRALGRARLRLVEAAAVRDPARFPELIAAAIRAGVDRVVVGGGDGTVCAAANVLAGTPVALAILPLGTGNDFARSLGIPADLAAAAEVAARGERRQVDLGRIGDRFFLNAASFGLTSEVTRRLTPGLKRRAGPAAYPLAAALSVARHRPFRVSIEAPDGTRELDAVQVVVGNGRYHGGGALIAPGAALDDRRLDLYVVESLARADGRRPSAAARARNLWLLWRYALLLRRGRHLEHGRIHHLRARSFTVSAEPPQRLGVDGEPAGETPARFEVVPGALVVMAPPGR